MPVFFRDRVAKWQRIGVLHRCDRVTNIDRGCENWPLLRKAVKDSCRLKDAKGLGYFVMEGGLGSGIP